MLLPTELLAAVSSFLWVKLVTICLEEPLTDSFVLQEALSQDFYTAFVKVENTSSPFPKTGKNEQIFVCPFSMIPKEHKSFLPESHWLTEFPGMELIARLPLRLDSNLITLSGSGDNVSLTEWFRIKDGETQHVPLGTWSPQTGLVVPHPVKWQRRGDLRGAELIDSVLLGYWPPICIVRLRQDSSVETRGFLPEALDVLSSRLNFTVQHVLAGDNEYGRMTPAGTWTGIVGQLNEKNADLSTSGLSITHERSQVIGYTVGVFINHVTILTRDPKIFGFRNKLCFWAYLTVFTWVLWIFVFLFLFVMGLWVGLVLFKTSQTKYQLCFQRGFAASFLVLLQKGMDSLSPDQIKTATQRITFLTLAMGSLLLFIGYNADLTSFLTASSPAVRLSTFKVS